MQQAIALARVPAGVQSGDTVHVEIRDKQLAASVVKLPFVRNGKVLAALNQPHRTTNHVTIHHEPRTGAST